MSKKITPIPMHPDFKEALQKGVNALRERERQTQGEATTDVSKYSRKAIWEKLKRDGLLPAWKVMPL